MWALLYVKENKNSMTQNLFVKVTIKYSPMHTKLQNNWCFFNKDSRYNIYWQDKTKVRLMTFVLC